MDQWIKFFCFIYSNYSKLVWKFFGDRVSIEIPSLWWRWRGGIFWARNTDIWKIQGRFNLNWGVYSGLAYFIPGYTLGRGLLWVVRPRSALGFFAHKYVTFTSTFNTHLLIITLIIHRKCHLFGQSISSSEKFGNEELQVGLPSHICFPMITDPAEAHL